MRRGHSASLVVACVVVSSNACVSLRPAPDHAVCPIPRSQERAELRARGDHTSEEPVLGVVPDAASVLNRTELRLSGDVAAKLDTPAMSAPDLTSYMFSQDLTARISGRDWSLFVAKGAAQEFLHASDEQTRDWTTTRVGAGWRQVRGIAANHVRGMGARLDVAHGDGSGRLLAHRPIDGLRFADGWSGQLSGEVRYELRGCFAPFLHMQFAGRVHESGWAVPIGAIVGAHRDVGDEPIMVWGGYEVTGRGLDQDGRSFDQRLRLGAEALSLGSVGLRVGASFEIMVGPVDGTFASVTVTAPLAFGRPKAGS